MKSIATICILAIACSSIISCGSVVKVSSDYDRTADFSKYKTFGFYQLSDKSESVSELNKTRIINAIKAELTKKGLTENDQNPDVLVNATTILENKKSVSSNTNYYGYGGYYRPYAWGPGFSGTTTYNVYDYKDGSLIIDIVAASNKQLLWQGTGNKEIDKPSKDPDHDIAEAVAKILSNFPPAAKK
ncbi:MAG TPA: DUF4136 domain-containing protein [Panacibacter sp.]|nr:DUF4136 domain-containing protein [Panacibacter sp.]HNP46412.1 DUF4136 domain-containing protein [Panacibacter sp.]